MSPSASPSPRRRLLQLASPAARVTAYLREAGRRGAAAVYWNAAPIPLEVALRRAGRLQPGADVDLLEGRVLVVEPLPPRLRLSGPRTTG